MPNVYFLQGAPATDEQMAQKTSVQGALYLSNDVSGNSNSNRLYIGRTNTTGGIKPIVTPTPFKQIIQFNGATKSSFDGTADVTTNIQAVSLVSSTNNALARFDGTGGFIKNSTVTLDDNGNINTPGILRGSTYEAYLLWGGKNFSGSYGPIDAAMVPELGANRLAFMPAAGVEIQYSTNGGATWSDYSTSDAYKIDLFNGNGHSYIIGASTATGIDKSNYQLRVIITNNTAQVYTQLNKFVIYCSTNGSSGSWCTIDAKTKANVDAGNDTWVTFANKVSINGWSGYNIINTSAITTYGNTTAQYQKLRFTFGVNSHPSSSSYRGLEILKIMGYGGVGWTTPSTMARTGRMYTYDANQNVIFPADVKAPSFTGKLIGNANTATKLQTIRTINGMKFDGSSNVNNYGVCDTAAATAAKTVTVGNNVGFELAVGAQVHVKFTYANSAANPTLNVNGTGAKPIYQYGTTASSTGTVTGGWTNGAIQTFTYDGTGWVRDYWYNSTYNFSGTTFYSGDSSTAEHDANNIIKNGHYYYTSNGPTTTLGATTSDGAIYAQAYSDSWIGQIAQDYRDGSLFVRGKNNGTWQNWLSIPYSTGGQFTVEKSVPNNAVFTDIHVTAVENHYTPSGGTTTSASGGILTDITNSSSGIQVLTGITKDAAGHITGVTSIALKSTNTNTDTNVTQTVTTTNATYPLLLAPSGQTATTTTSSYFASGVTLNPSTNTITANITGSAASATNATNSSKLYVNATSADTNYYILGATGTGNQSIYRALNSSGTANTTGVYFNGVTGVLFGAAWNDYAEFRQSDESEAGRVVCETGKGDLILSTERLQPGAEIISDTFGFAIGETDKCKTPIAASGRVLAYTFENRYEFKAGDVVCAAPGGTVSKMTRDEIINYPDRIIGTVSEIPEYDTWGQNNIKVNNRIWIRIR